MRGAEFLRAVKALGKRRGVEVYQDRTHGKGSHSRLFYGDKFTTLVKPTQEIGLGLLHDMLNQLGLNKKDLFD